MGRRARKERIVDVYMESVHGHEASDETLHAERGINSGGSSQPNLLPGRDSEDDEKHSQYPR